MQTNHDWSALAADWQRQETPSVDIEAIRIEAERRSRSLRRVIRVEIGFSLLVIAACIFLAASPRSDRLLTLLFSGMAVYLTGYQALMVWIRRRDLVDAGQDVRALVDREIQRAATVQRYWRWGMWASLGIWLGMYALLLSAMARDMSLPVAAGLFAGTAINVAVIPVMGVYGLWRSSQARARQRRFQALREQLRAP